MDDELGEIIGLTGETGSLSLKDSPVLYFPSSEVNFVFASSYSPPDQEVNFVFPDISSIIFSPFDAASGELAIVDELILGEIVANGFTGENLSFDLDTTLFIPISNAYSGEIGDGDLTISLWLDCDAFAGEWAREGTLVLPDPIYFESDNYTGENTQSSLDCEILFTVSGFTGELSCSDLTTNASEFVSVDPAYAGELGNTDVDIFISEPLGLINGIEGSTGNLDVSVEQSLTPIGYASEVADSSLSISQLFFAIGNTGEIADSDLSIYVSEPLGLIDGVAGENQFVDLSVEQNLPADGVAGELGATSVDIFISEPLGLIDGVAGENQFVDLSVEQSLTPIGYASEVAGSDLSIYVSEPLGLINGDAGSLGILLFSLNQRLPSIAYSGELGQLSLLTFPSESIGVLEHISGEVVLLQISVTISLKNIFGYSGEYSAPFDLITLPSVALSQLNGNDGAIATVSHLNENPLFFLRNYDGVNANSDLVFSEAEPIFVRSYSGENSFVSLSTIDILNLNSAYTGETHHKVYLTEEPNIFCWAGENCEVSLSAEYALSVVYADGASGLITFDNNNLPFYFDSFIALSGEQLDCLLNQFWITYFRLRTTAGVIAQCDIDSETNFDLSSHDCCVTYPASNNLNLHLAKAPNEPYGLKAEKDIIKVNFELWRPIEISLRVYDGCSAKVVYKEDCFELRAYEGCNSNFEFVQDLNHRHTKGYFIPDGNWVVVELADILPDDDIVHRGYTGETSTCYLSNQYYFNASFYTGNNTRSSLENTNLHFLQLRAYSGEVEECNIKEDMPMVILAETGEVGYVPTFSLTQIFKQQNFTGECFECELFDPPMMANAYSGETGENIYLSAHYLIEFLEDGCLDNEFRYYDENDVEIEELFEDTPIEGDPYYHKVKARCISERSLDDPLRVP